MRAVDDRDRGPLQSEFAREFVDWMDQQKELDAGTEAGAGGSWRVEEVPSGGFGVFREGESEPVMIFEKEASAYLAAAAFVVRGMEGEPAYRLQKEPDERGRYPLLDRDGQVVGDLEEPDEKAVEALNMAERFRRSPEAKQLLMKGASRSTLEQTGSIVASYYAGVESGEIEPPDD